jgi:hypothetical protein
MSETFVIDRGPRESSVEFIGDCLGSASSHAPTKKFWTEITIYRTRAGKYVTHILGNTSVPGKIQRHTVHVYNTAKEMITGLCQDGAMSKLAYEAADQAADVDDEMFDALDVHDEVQSRSIHID